MTPPRLDHLQPKRTDARELLASLNEIKKILKVLSQVGGWRIGYQIDLSTDSWASVHDRHPIVT